MALLEQDGKEFTKKVGGERLSKYTWVANSGACCHMINNANDMYDTQDLNEHVTIRNGKRMVATKLGTIRRVICHKDGSRIRVTMTAKYVTDLWVTLFSITKAIDKGG